jgi:hypothetical protein
MGPVIAEAVGMRLTTGIALLAILGATACHADFTCPTPASLQPVRGVATFTGSRPDADGGESQVSVQVDWSFDATVALVEFDPDVASTTNATWSSDPPTYCGPQTFTVAMLGVCALTADVTDVDGVNPAEVTATIRPGASCGVPVDTGTATVVVGSGALSLDEVAGTLKIDLAGTSKGASVGLVYLNFEGGLPNS